MKTEEMVGRFVSDLRYENIPPPVILEAKKAIIDCLGVSIAAFREPCLDILFSFIEKMGGRPSSTLFGTNVRTSPAWAALYNGTMAHALDFDDGAGLHIPLHPSVSVLPAVIALGEFVGAKGRQILEAFITGEEVECKLAQGCSREAYELGWHATGVFGTMGATAASAKLLDLSAGRVPEVLGIALSLLGGVRQNFGTMVKPLHAGTAAMNGIMSALLGRDGYTATDAALEGSKGFGRIFGGKDLAEQCRTLGRPFHLVRGVSIKKYPSCYASHSALDNLLGLIERHRIDYRDIQEIDCRLSPFQLEGLPYLEPKTPLEGKFSMPFLLAVACVYGKVGLKHFREEVLRDKEIINLCRKVNLSADKDIGPLGSKLLIRLADQKSVSNAVDKPKGHPTNPLCLQEVEEKFRSCGGLWLSEERTKKILDVLLHIEELDDIHTLTGALRCDLLT
jgi:2-methylcitrate dehydratase PrpD